MNIFVQIFMWTLLWDMYLGVGLLDYVVNLGLTF